MDPRLPNGTPLGFAKMSPPGHLSGEMPQSQSPAPTPPQPPHNQQQQLAAETPLHLGPNTHLQNSAYRAKGQDQPKNRSRRIKSLNLDQVASPVPVPRCRHLASQISLEEITFWTNVCNMWLLEEKQKQQADHGEQEGGGERMMGMSSLAPEATTGQEYYYNKNNYINNNYSPSHHSLHGEAATIDQTARNYHHHHHHHPPPPSPPLHPTSTITNIHSNGVEAIRAALNQNIYEDPTMPISIAATVGPPQSLTPLSAHHYHHHHHHDHHQHTNYPSPWMMQSQQAPTAATTRRTADYQHNPYATMPRRGGRRDWRGQVPRPAGLQTRAEREFNGVDVYGRYKPDA